MPENISAHVNEEQLDVFLHRYFNQPLPHGSVSTILSEAFNALIDAGVVVLDTDQPHGQPTFDVHGGRVRLQLKDSNTGDAADTWWTPQGGLPSLDAAIKPIVDLLVAIVKSPPWTGAIDFPHSRN